MRSLIIKIIFFLLFPCLVRGQAGDPAVRSDSSGNWHAGIELQAGATSKNAVPFWMRTNHFSSIPLSGVSGSLLAYAGRDYIKEEEEDKPRLTDWGFGISGRLNAGNTAQFLLTEAYIKGRLSIFQLKAGRSKDIDGLADSSLSAGAFSVSGNALGIPKIELSVPEYWYVPLTGKLIALKGSFAHGWFGATPLRYTRQDSSVHSWYHQSSFYGRIGKPDWRLKLYAGINHQVMWGHEKSIEPAFDLSTLESFWYVVRGVEYGSWVLPTSKIGNHLGSLDQGIQYDFNALGIMAYHQFFYDIGGLYHGSNLKDGLWGIVFRNKKAEENASFGWRKILLEYFGSKSQGGEPDTPRRAISGAEDYYNNYTYAQGWTYEGENIGNNFLTGRKYARPGQVMRDFENIINNRVQLLHIGIEGYLGKWSWRTKLSFSNNFGTYATNAEGGPAGRGRWIIYPPPYFEKVKQFSGYIAADRPLNKNYRIGFVLAADRGKLLNNSVGGLIKVSRVW